MEILTNAKINIKIFMGFVLAEKFNMGFRDALIIQNITELNSHWPNRVQASKQDEPVLLMYDLLHFSIISSTPTSSTMATYVQFGFSSFFFGWCEII